MGDSRFVRNFYSDPKERSMTSNGNGVVEAFNIFDQVSRGDWRSKLSVTLERIDPETAMEYLSHNTKNYRKKDVRHYKTLAKDMREGRWHFGPATIAFEMCGILVDGQNRLMAIIESGHTAEFLVVRGMPNGSAELPGIDGGKKRRVDTHLTKQGIVNAPACAAAARLLLAIRAGNAKQRCEFMSDTQIVAIVKTNASIEEASQKANCAFRISKPSVMTAWYWLASHDDSALADECVQILGGQMESFTSHPFAKCREVFLSMKSDKTSVATPTDLLVRYLMSAWQKAQRGESVKLLRPLKDIPLSDAAEAALAHL